MASVHCPKSKRITPMGKCTSCEWIGKNEDVSTIWCRFTIGKECEKPNENTIRARIGKKEKLAEKYYKMGRQRIADEIYDEIYQLKRELGEM